MKFRKERRFCFTPNSSTTLTFRTQRRRNFDKNNLQQKKKNKIITPQKQQRFFRFHFAETIIFGCCKKKN